MSRTVMQQALEALESKYIVNCGAWRVQQDQAITALKQALAEPERRPLTDEEIRGLADKRLFYQPEGYEVSGIFNFARAIERAHGITGEQT